MCLRVLGLAAMTVVCTALTGCGGPRFVPVSGTITHQSKPVGNLIVNFTPEEGRASWGMTDDNGRFTLEYDRDRKGALVATHTVWVEYRPTDPAQEAAIAAGEASLPPDVKAVREKYGSLQTSPLTIEITAATDNLEVKLD